MRYPSEQLCTISAADRGADVQFAPEGFAPRWSLPSPFHGEEAKLPKGCGAFRTADQTISSLCGAYALPAESIHIAKTASGCIRRYTMETFTIHRHNSFLDNSFLGI